MPRRLLRTAFSAVVFASLIWAPSALADTFTPGVAAGRRTADDIDTLYKLTLYIGIVIFLLVEGVLIWSLVKYRARRGGAARPRSAATRRSRSAGRSAPRRSWSCSPS